MISHFPDSFKIVWIFPDNCERQTRAFYACREKRYHALREEEDFWRGKIYKTLKACFLEYCVPQLAQKVAVGWPGLACDDNSAKRNHVFALIFVFWSIWIFYSIVFLFCTAIGRRSRGQVKDDNSAKRNQLNAVVRSHQSTFSIIYSYYPFTNSFLSIVIIPKSLDHRIRSLELFRFLPVPAMHTAVGNCLTLECNSRTIQIFDFNFANNMSSARNVLVC